MALELISIFRFLLADEATRPKAKRRKGDEVYEGRKDLGINGVFR
jgi:hypothetical protein